MSGLSRQSLLFSHSLSVTLLLSLTPTKQQDLLEMAAYKPPLIYFYIIKKMIKSSDGKDKILKAIQYSAKLYLLLFLSSIKKVEINSKLITMTHTNTTNNTHTHTNTMTITKTNTNTKNMNLVKSRDSVQSLCSSFSTARKIIRLGHWIEGITDIIDFCQSTSTVLSTVSSAVPSTISSTSTVPSPILSSQISTLTFFDKARLSQLLTFIHLCLGVMNDLTDDIVCLSKIGFLDSRWSSLFSPISDRLWYLSLLMDLYCSYNQLDTQRSNLHLFQSIPHPNNQKNTINQSINTKEENKEFNLKDRIERIHLLKMGILKLGVDWLFCTIDVFGLQDKGLPEWVQVAAGFVSAVLGNYKVYQKSL